MKGARRKQRSAETTRSAMCTCADSLLLAPCNTWLCAVSSSLWCIWWPRCGTRATGGSVTFSRSLWSSNVILCGSCYAVSCLSGQYVEVQVNDMLSARGKQSSKVRRKFFLFSADASRADKSPHEPRRCVILQREFVQYTACILSTRTSDFTHGWSHRKTPWARVEF